jgi:2-polyprenyl-3-methyl-5-hydroxy-6-metoxy-1,4-benzoquinol methylase
MSDSDKHWEAWGRLDPYFGVCSRQEFRRESFERNREAFFASGEAFVSDTISQMEIAFGTEVPRSRALDFGCGVGRLTIPLARRFQHVTGLDVSPSMLQEAARNHAALGLANIDLRLADDALSSLDGTFDFVNSYIVLQHIPVRRGDRIIRRLLGRVGANGFAMLHVALRRRGALKTAVYLAKRHVPGLRVVANVIQGKRVNEPFMQLNQYDLATVVESFARHGMDNVLVTLEDHGLILTARIAGHRGAAGPGGGRGA